MCCAVDQVLHPAMLQLFHARASVSCVSGAPMCLSGDCDIYLHTLVCLPCCVFHVSARSCKSSPAIMLAEPRSNVLIVYLHYGHRESACLNRCSILTQACEARAPTRLILHLLDWMLSCMMTVSGAQLASASRNFTYLSWKSSAISSSFVSSASSRFGFKSGTEILVGIMS
jgi:hypothetical protein